jgi:hypothetical protein
MAQLIRKPPPCDNFREGRALLSCIVSEWKYIPGFKNILRTGYNLGFCGIHLRPHLNLIIKS